MKKLSVEEKAKAYDNVREKIAVRFGSNVAKEIFSEYEEPEDERIRKWLIHYFKEVCDNVSEKEKKGVLAYLEKQGDYNRLIEEIKKCKEIFSKEKEKAISTNDKLSLGGRIAILEELLAFTKEKQGEQKPTEEYNITGIKSKYAQGKLGEMIKRKLEIEKQGEQKPVDKIEPKFKVKYAGNEYNVLEIKDIAGITYYGIEDEPNHIDYVLPENCERVDGYSIKENGSLYPTKPAKFSEQDSVWSEEDITTISRVISIVKWAAYSDHSHPILNDKGATELVERLNSIKDIYTWKPSDEQITWLYRAADDASKDSRMKQVLENLLSDLKKLREK